MVAKEETRALYFLIMDGMSLNNRLNKKEKRNRCIDMETELHYDSLLKAKEALAFTVIIE